MNPTQRILSWTAPVLLATTAPAVADVYFTEAQALAAIFGREASVTREEKRLTPEDRQRLEAASGLRFPEPSYTFFLAQEKERITGYAVVLEEIGKSEPITFMIGISPEGKVTEVVVMVFRESRGWEVREQRFLRQFRGKSFGDPIRVNQDIVNLTGATLSSKAIARGVKRALLLRELFYSRGAGPERAREMKPQSRAIILPALPQPMAEACDAGLYRQIRCRMGTLAEIRVWSDSARAAAESFNAGFAELERLEEVFSLYRGSSELARVNREAGAGAVEVSEEFWRLTSFAVRAARHSAGAFDITLGPLARLWDFREREPRVPRERELAAAMRQVGMDKLALDRRTRTIRFLAPEMELDFGGLAKGYAAERVARLLTRQGARAALVNLGRSSLSAAGRAPRDGGPQEMHWVVAIADPRAPAKAAFAFILGDGWSVSTSGTYEQKFSAAGRTLSHLIDPRTGWPVEGISSATVVSRSGARGEALTKPLLVLRGHARERWLRRAGRRRDWALGKVSADGKLLLRQRFRHATILLPVV